VSGNHLEASRRLDLVNFIDYLCVNVYGGTLDWPGNNWRAAREKVAGARWRFYIWDAEGALGGFGQDVFHNTFTSELAGGPEIATLYQRLKPSPEFRMLFADRIQKHYFNKGALTDLSISNRFIELRNTVSGTIPNFDNTILNSWLPQRHAVVLGHFASEGLLASANAPSFNQHGGRVPAGFNLTLTASNGLIYYTTNGADPRVPYTGAVAPEALSYTNGSPVRLEQSTLVRTRSLVDGTNWSALVEAEFVIGRLGLPLRFTEIMYHPDGGDAFEFIELQNTGVTALDLSGISLQGVTFLFPQGATLAAGATLVLSSSANPAAFAARYPSVTVFGTFGGSLANGGERLALIDRLGNTIISVDYNDANGWPKAADGGGPSIEIIDANGDPDDPLNWRASAMAGGTPGSLPSPAPPAVPEIRLNEIMAHNLSAVASGTNYFDWIELFNGSTQTVIVAGWSLTDDGDERKFVFPAATEIAAGGFLLVWCATNAPGYHTGFSLRREGETVALFDAQTNRVDAVTFGSQIADFSIGRLGAGWLLNTPTPAATNLAAPLGSITNLVINEWMANPLPGADDWVELYNLDTNRPVALHGLFFGTVTNALDQIRSLSFIAPGGYALFLCDERPGADHFDLKLPAAGSPLVLYEESGAVLNSVLNAAQLEGVSRGRSPDGSASLANFAGRATPGGPNAPTSYPGPILNEVMARNATAVTNDAGRVVDWIELFNPRSTNYPIGGMSLSVDVSQAGQWTVPAGVVVPALGYLVIWCDEESPPSLANSARLNLGRSLADNSGGVYLFDSGAQLKDSVEYGFQVTNLTLGKISGTWRLCAAPTPGAANASPASLGPQNTLKINEWMANPSTGDDWFELYNPNTQPVSLGGFYLTDDPSIAGQTRFAASALSFIGARSWIKIEADGNAAKGRHHVNFSLDGDGETLRIYLSTTLIDSVDFGLQTTGVSQGRLPDGGSNIVSFPTTPTPGSMNLADIDGDGLPDLWESANGLNPLLADDADGDADHDGVSNRDEYLAGTDPQNPQSYLKIDARNAAAGSVTLGFEAVAGKTYSILYREAGGTGPWFRLKDFSAAATTHRVEIIDATGGGATRFYRLVTPRL
jgi:hypothetical protein